MLNEPCKYGYEGVACNSCESNFYRFRNECMQCPENSQSYFWLGVAVMVLVFIPAALRLSRLFSRMPSLNIAIGITQMLALFGRFDLHWPRILKWTLFNISFLNIDIAVVHPSCIMDQFSWSGKWLFTLAIPLPFVFVALFDIVGRHYLRLYTMRFGEATLRCIPSTLLSPMYPVSERYQSWRIFRLWRFLRMDVVRPIFLAFVIPESAESYAVHVRGRVRQLLALAKICFIPLTLTLTEYIDCSYDEGVEASFLDADPTVQCFTFSTSKGWGRFFALFLCAFVIYPLGILFLFTSLLARAFGNLNNPNTVDLLGFVIQNFRKKYYYFELVGLFRKSIILAIYATFSNATVSAAMKQGVFSMMVLIPTLLLQQRCMPYAYTWLNRLEASCLLTEILVLFTGLVTLSDKTSVDFSNGLGAFCVLLILSNYVLLAAAILHENSERSGFINANQREKIIASARKVGRVHEIKRWMWERKLKTILTEARAGVLDLPHLKHTVGTALAEIYGNRAVHRSELMNKQKNPGGLRARSSLSWLQALRESGSSEDTSKLITYDQAIARFPKLIPTLDALVDAIEDHNLTLMEQHAEKLVDMMKTIYSGVRSNIWATIRALRFADMLIARRAPSLLLSYQANRLMNRHASSADVFLACEACRREATALLASLTAKPPEVPVNVDGDAPRSPIPYDQLKPLAVAMGKAISLVTKCVHFNLGQGLLRQKNDSDESKDLEEERLQHAKSVLDELLVREAPNLMTLHGTYLENVDAEIEEGPEKSSFLSGSIVEKAKRVSEERRREAAEKGGDVPPPAEAKSDLLRALEVVLRDEMKTFTLSLFRVAVDHDAPSGIHDLDVHDNPALSSTPSEYGTSSSSSSMGTRAIFDGYMPINDLGAAFAQVHETVIGDATSMLYDAYATGTLVASSDLHKTTSDSTRNHVDVEDTDRATARRTTREEVRRVLTEAYEFSRPREGVRLGHTGLLPLEYVLDPSSRVHLLENLVRNATEYDAIQAKRSKINDDAESSTSSEDSARGAFREEILKWPYMDVVATAIELGCVDALTPANGMQNLKSSARSIVTWGKGKEVRKKIQPHVTADQVRSELNTRSRTSQLGSDTSSGGSGSYAASSAAAPFQKVRSYKLDMPVMPNDDMDTEEELSLPGQSPSDDEGENEIDISKLSAREMMMNHPYDDRVQTAPSRTDMQDPRTSTYVPTLQRSLSTGPAVGGDADVSLEFDSRYPIEGLAPPKKDAF